MIIFDSVGKKYSSRAIALDDINLRVEDGEFVFLVGPSGAGKTTMLRLLNREIIPNRGRIHIDDWEVHNLPDKKLPYLRRKVGFIFQDFKLLNDRTVNENVGVALEILNKSRQEIDERVQQVLKIVHLENKEYSFPKQLSLGEQQRVAIARAIAGETKILLADEPTGNLDPKTSWEILKILNEINKNGTTVLMSTHNVDIVNSMKKRVVELVNGKIIRDEKKSRYS